MMSTLRCCYDSLVVHVYYRLSDSKIVVTTSDSLSVLSLPSLDTVYSIPVSNPLLADSYTGQLMIHYLTEDGPPGTPPKLTYIAQISPEARYDMMIKRQQYTEALAFAKMHSLNTQVCESDIGVVYMLAIHILNMHCMSRKKYFLVKCFILMALPLHLICYSGIVFF